MQQLTGLDAAFLAMETPSVYGHVGSLCIVDPSTAAEPMTLERISRVVESRLHLVPPFRRRLATVPLGLDMPWWIEDPDFDIEYHVREIALPAPGDDRQLAEQAARLHARPLDRRRPLWELYLITGLAGGRAAIYTKVHHAAIDGVSGNDVLAALLDTRPEGRDLEPAPEWQGEAEPGMVGLLARSASSLTAHPARAFRLARSLGRMAPGLLSSNGGRLPVVGRFLRSGQSAVLSQTPLRAPRTPFNRTISPHRRWAFRTVPFTDVKAVKDAAGCTVNDVVMAMTAGALRTWLSDHDALPDVPLIAAIPVSVRTEEQRGQLGNRVSTMTAPLPTDTADPLERLRLSQDAMRAAKDTHGALPADLLADVTEFALPALAGQAARLNARLRLLEWLSPFNLMVSNIPGPNVPLYYAGARLLAYYPLSAISDGQGLNITVISQGGGMHFGLLACRELVPDLDDMAGHLVTELAALRTAAARAA